MAIPQSYAVNTDGCASSVPIALWCARGERVDKPKEGEFPYEVHLEPVQGAYVACVRMREGQASTIIRRERDIRYGRTNSRGWVELRQRPALLSECEDDIPEHPYQPADVDWSDVLVRMFAPHPVAFQQESPCADPRLLACLPNEDCRVFWCHHQELFTLFAEQLEAEDPHEVLDRWGA